MTKVYRIAWVSEKQILESFKHTKKEADKLKDELSNDGLYPFMTCDFTERLVNEDLRTKIYQMIPTKIGHDSP